MIIMISSNQNLLPGTEVICQEITSRPTGEIFSLKKNDGRNDEYVKAYE